MPLTRRPNIWLIAALSLSVHSATTLARISFMYNMKAFRGFLMCGFFLSEKKKQTCWAAIWSGYLTQIQGFDHYDWLSFKHMANGCNILANWPAVISFTHFNVLVSNFGHRPTSKSYQCMCKQVRHTCMGTFQTQKQLWRRSERCSFKAGWIKEVRTWKIILLSSILNKN